MQNGNNHFTLRNINTVTSDNKPGAIRSINRAVDILTCLSDGIDTLIDITATTGLSKPTVYRILKTLEDIMMVTQDPVSHRYYLGPLVHQLASNPETNHQYLTSCAYDELRRLWEYSGETVELNAMVGFHYLRIYEIPSKYDLKVIAGPDPVGSIHVGAAAKVLLAQIEDDELKASFNSINLSRVTENSVVEPRILLSQVQEIRKRGYEISHGERIAGALCVSAPVLNYYWPVALSLVGPEIRLNSKQETVIREVLTSANRISLTLKEFLLAKGVKSRRQFKSRPSAQLIRGGL